MSDNEAEKISDDEDEKILSDFSDDESRENEEIFTTEERINIFISPELKINLKEESKSVCLYGSCKKKPKYNCKCCNLVFCLDHSFIDAHLPLIKSATSPCSSPSCKGNVDTTPALSNVDNDLLCCNCILSKNELQLKIEWTEKKLHALFSLVQILAFKKVPMSLDHLVAILVSRNFKHNFSIEFMNHLKTAYLRYLFLLHFPDLP